MTLRAMQDVNLSGQRVLIREDLNVPFDSEGEISNDARIRAAIPTIKLALKAGARVMVISHLGRPKEGVKSPEHSLEPVAQRLSELLKMDVPLVSSWLDGEDIAPAEGSVVLLENVRYNTGEKDNSETLAESMAKLCDVFVMDAFATAHRKEASTYGVALKAPIACAGPLLLKEIEAITAITKKPKKPVVAIVGGSKVSTKLHLLESLLEWVDVLIVGGGIANTFLAAQGYEVGKSLYEADLIDEAERLMILAESKGIALPLPSDVMVTEKIGEESYVEPVAQVGEDEKILDVGPDTIKAYIHHIKEAKTILWNGPVGMFEVEAFSKGTRILSKAIADGDATVVAGGGDTLTAIEKYDIADKIDTISTGGGAFLALLEGKTLPAVEALEEHAKTAKSA